MILKKIKWECSKLNKSIIKEEKESEIKKKSDKENFEKDLPQETLPEVKQARASLVWYGEVKRLRLKSKDGKDLDGRFCTLLRKSLHLEADMIAVSTFSKPHDIVSYIKRKYIDSRQTINSCVQGVLSAQKPR